MIGKVLTGALLTLFVAVCAHGEVIESTEDGRREVSVTVYNNDLGLVREIREIKLPGGETHLRYGGVASRIDPTSVSVNVLKGLKGFELLKLTDPGFPERLQGGSRVTVYAYVPVIR